VLVSVLPLVKAQVLLMLMQDQVLFQTQVDLTQAAILIWMLIHSLPQQETQVQVQQVLSVCQAHQSMVSQQLTLEQPVFQDLAEHQVLLHLTHQVEAEDLHQEPLQVVQVTLEQLDQEQQLLDQDQEVDLAHKPQEQDQDQQPLILTLVDLQVDQQVDQLEDQLEDIQVDQQVDQAESNYHLLHSQLEDVEQ